MSVWASTLSKARAAEHGLSPGSKVIRLRFMAGGHEITHLYRYDTACAWMRAALERDGIEYVQDSVPWDGTTYVSLDNGD